MARNLPKSPVNLRAEVRILKTAFEILGKRAGLSGLSSDPNQPFQNSPTSDFFEMTWKVDLLGT